MRGKTNELDKDVITDYLKIAIAWCGIHIDELTWIQLRTVFILNMGASLETLRLDT